MPIPVDSPFPTDLPETAASGARKPWRTPAIEDAEVGGVTNAGKTSSTLEAPGARSFFKPGS